MPKYIVTVIQTHEYEVEITAKDQYEALELVRDYDGDDLEPYETDARWDYEVLNSKGERYL